MSEQAETSHRNVTPLLASTEEPQPPQTEVPRDVVLKGMKLLRETARGYDNSVLSYNQTADILKQMIAGTEFAKASIEFAQEDFPHPYKKMESIMGKIDSAGYSVWFERDAVNGWKLKYSRYKQKPKRK